MPQYPDPPEDLASVWPLEEGHVDILIVDDRPDKRLVYQTILEDLGPKIYMADSGQAALKRVLEREFAVILLDVNMPGMDGLETAALIRNRGRSAHVPIIFITADYNDESHMARGYALGAVDYIGSPVVPEILRAKVRVFVDLYRLAQQAKRQARQQLALVEERVARATAEQATKRLAFLAQAGATLATSLDGATVSRELVHLCVPAVADACALTLFAEGAAEPGPPLLWPEPQAGSDETVVSGQLLSEAVSPWLRPMIERVISTGEPEVASGLPLELAARERDTQGAGTKRRAAALSSVAVVPLVAGGSTLGTLSLGLCARGREFDTDALSMATKLAGRAAIALDNARLHEKVQEQDRRKDEFLAMLAHELRNPLAPISNAVHVLRERSDSPTTVAWAGDVIGRQLRLLVRLVDDLLDVSRITRGKIELKIESIDAARVIAAAVETSRPYVDAQEHALVVSVPPEPLRLKGDFARVAQVLANLINNAAKYTDKGGRIAIDAAREGEEIVFRVRDSGMGIPKELLSTIFEPFQQIERTLDRSQGGLGVGLTLAQRLVEMQGGSIIAHSEGPDRGSEFTVRLPGDFATDAPESPTADTPAPETALDLRVLIVDDNRDVAHSTALLLRAAGCNVDLAYDGEEAVRVVRTLQPDVVLLDLGLPKLDGYQVAERIRADRSSVNSLIIALSGYGQDEHRLRSKRAGFDYHIVKPIDPAALTGLLASLWSCRKPEPGSEHGMPLRKSAR
ncbi:MAG TPA: response regulator [Casimicrobiaceae bacterium]|nr:response regulator [Casimicrobiaceae bacterium]